MNRDRKVVVYSRQGKYIKTCKNAQITALTFNVNLNSIYNTCNNKAKTSNGLIFKYKGDKNLKYNLSRHKEGKTIEIIQQSIDNKFIKKWISSAEISKKLGIPSSNVVACCKGNLRSCKGYKWKYA